MNGHFILNIHCICDAWEYVGVMRNRILRNSQGYRNMMTWNLSWYQVHVVYSVSITVTSPWAEWRLILTESWLFTQPFVQVEIKKTSKLRVTGLCEGNSPVTGEFHTQRAHNADDVIMSEWVTNSSSRVQLFQRSVKLVSEWLPYTNFRFQLYQRSILC